MRSTAEQIRLIGEEIVKLADMLERPDDAPPPKFEDVRAALAALSRQGHTKEMKELLTRFGAEKLSEVKASDYAALLAAAKEVSTNA